MKYIIGLAILHLLFLNQVYSQKDTSKIASNIVYMELGGVGSYGSLNYERVIYRKNQFMFSTRLGISTLNIKDYTNSFNPDLIIPLLFNGCYGNKNKVEIGLGQVLTNIVQADLIHGGTKRITKFHTIFSLGYRFQTNINGLFFRCTYTPIIEYNESFRHWGGISIGYSF